MQWSICLSPFNLVKVRETPFKVHVSQMIFAILNDIVTPRIYLFRLCLEISLEDILIKCTMAHYKMIEFPHEKTDCCIH